MARKVKLDETNLRMLNALQTQARLTSGELSDRLGLSQSACLERWRKLEKCGAIRRYRTDIDLDRVTPNVRVFAEVTLDGQRPEDFKAFLDVLDGCPEVVAAYRISGPFDVMVCFVCRDVRRYHDLSEQLIETVPGITRFSGHVVLGRIKGYSGYPLGTLSGLDLPPPPPPPPPAEAAPLRLDALHLKILHCLQTDGRISNLALAEKVALSPSPCLERVKRLEAHGYIGQYVTEIDLDACLPHVYLMAEVTLESHFTADFKRFEERVRGIAEIISCYKIAGPYDYTMDIICRDMTHFRELEDYLTGRDMALAKLRFHVVLQRMKLFAGFPLERLVAG
ncbi:Lrp/AsnC family transcriptional regulator [Caenispirillum bisanense]|uniref:Lrp/AsnC family transcriptional regulator n=1 Tax=Caenispirillum bisanense TaxID=414052 RepID=UPI0031E348AB